MNELSYTLGYNSFEIFLNNQFKCNLPFNYDYFESITNNIVLGKTVTRYTELAIDYIIKESQELVPFLADIELAIFNILYEYFSNSFEY